MPCLIVFGLDWFSVSLCVVVCGVSVFVVFVLAWCGCGFVCLVGYALFCFVVCWCVCFVLLCFVLFCFSLLLLCFVLL